jgi:glycerol-3-phosphate dehydrogenase (NAD(P)+)
MKAGQRVGVIGAGSWGTVLASLLADQGVAVDLWAFEEEVAEQIRLHRENKTYLPGIGLSPLIHATPDMAEAASGKSVILLVVPSHVYREVVLKLKEHLSTGCTVVSATKGVENASGCRMTQILEELLPPEGEARWCVLSGPSFAREVAWRLPTAVTIASLKPTVGMKIQSLLSCSYFRCYTSSDLIGVELGGAIKNVIAIAAGAAQGLGLGHNANAALITRGLAEMSRLGIKMGANPLTFSGLAGLGDLVLTCTGELSRNRTVGYKIGQGMSLEEILAGMVMVAEGVSTCKALYELGQRENIELPICTQVYRILYEVKDPADAVKELMSRDLKAEMEGIQGLVF